VNDDDREGNPERHMSDAPPLSERLRRAFGPNPRGVVGVVDELLTACREQPLQFDWQAGTCRVRSLGAAGQEPIDVPLPKSVFRAILARLAALCNERTPDSVSPYGGSGEMVIGGDAPAVFRVTFTNTPDERRTEVRFVGDRSTALTTPVTPDAAPVTSPGAV
jgi:hypothetical protein